MSYSGICRVNRKQKQKPLFICMPFKESIPSGSEHKLFGHPPQNTELGCLRSLNLKQTGMRRELRRKVQEAPKGGPRYPFEVPLKGFGNSPDSSSQYGAISLFNHNSPFQMPGQVLMLWRETIPWFYRRCDGLQH